MEVQYICPHCRAAINACNYVILAAKAKNRNIGLVMLHEEIGNYTSKHSATLKVEIGEIIALYCPVCNHKLQTMRGDQFATFNRIDESGQESRIVISRKYGERITFRVEKGKPYESYGESVRKYMDPEWYLEVTD